MPTTALPPHEYVIAVLIRHGRTKLNNPRAPKLRAWDNVPLTDDGKVDIMLAAKRTKIYKPKMVYASDLARDSESALLYAELLGNIPMEMDFALRTADMGTLTAMSEEDTAPRVLRWYQRPTEPAPGGESLNQMAKRLWRFMEPKLELARESAAFRPMTFFTHGRPIAYLDSYYRGIPPEDARMPLPGGAAIIRASFDGVDTMEFLDETEPILSDV